MPLVFIRFLLIYYKPKNYDLSIFFRCLYEIKKDNA